MARQAARYVDGFVLPISKKKLKTYRAIAQEAGKVWRKHGALEYRECVGDDLNLPGLLPFPKLAGAKSGETVVFSWITYKSRAHRDRVNAKVMKDPAIVKMVERMKKVWPFDMKRMAQGGFKILVDA